MKRGDALTILELLCVVAVIAILLGLSLGPIQKERRRADAKIYQAALGRVYPGVRDNLRDFYRTKTNFPSWTADDLHDKGVLDEQVLRWIRSGWIEYYPFASTDPDSKYVMQFYDHTEPNGVIVKIAFMKSNVVNYASE